MQERTVLSTISKVYGLEGELKTLPGEVDLNYRFRLSSGGQYVFKIAGPERTSSEIEFQLSLLHHLANTDFSFALPQVLPTVFGEGSFTREIDAVDRIMHMLTWVDGRPLRALAHRSKSLLRAWGAVCGQLSNALKGFDHPQAHRYYRWDPQHCLDARAKLKHVLAEAEKNLAVYFFNMFEKEAKPQLASLRHSVNYNDAHEDNLLINDDPLAPTIIGLVDVGDAVHTQTINELAIACAYAGMDCEDPIAAMSEVITGYHLVFPIEEAELEVLFPLIAGRLLITVTSAAEARANDPENAYRAVSENQAWDVLRKLKKVHPRLAHYQFRAACGLVACPKQAVFEAWVGRAVDFGGLVKVGRKQLAQLDFSVGSAALGNYSTYADLGLERKYLLR